MKLIDTNLCMASKDGTLGGPRCQDVATHQAAALGRLCDKHAEELRASLRHPETLVNVIGRRVRTEDEIALIVTRLPEAP